MRWASTQLATPSILISTDMGSRDKSTAIEIPNDDSTIAIGNQCHLVFKFLPKLMSMIVFMVMRRAGILVAA